MEYIIKQTRDWLIQSLSIENFLRNNSAQNALRLFCQLDEGFTKSNEKFFFRCKLYDNTILLFLHR